MTAASDARLNGKPPKQRSPHDAAVITKFLGDSSRSCLACQLLLQKHVSEGRSPDGECEPGSGQRERE